MRALIRTVVSWMRRKPEPVAESHEQQDKRLRFEKTKPRLVRVRHCGERGIRGPAFVPSSEFHHVSRQVCRAYLRGVAFLNISTGRPHFSRKVRRKLASLMARTEYVRMMQDPTNVVNDGVNG